MCQNIQYHNATPLEISGRAFENTSTPFQRLPVDAATAVPEKIQHLSEMSAGLYIDFCTDSTEIWARLELLPNPDQEHVGFPHSVDLYTHGRERWQRTGILREMKRPLTEGRLVAGLSEQEKDFRLYLPHAGNIKQLEIGIIDGASFYQKKADPRLPVVCYGTSIVHGFAASRPGMTMPAQLGRRLNTPVVNLGFAGNARMDPELIPFMKQIEASVLTVDCLPNMSPDLVKERTIPFITAIRESHPERPIVLVENIVYQATHGLSDKRGGWGPKNDELKKQFAILISAGMPHLYYLNGEGLLGTDGEATVDGTHPSDLGMLRLTTAYESVLRPLLA